MAHSTKLVTSIGITQLPRISPCLFSRITGHVTGGNIIGGHIRVWQNMKQMNNNNNNNNNNDNEAPRSDSTHLELTELKAL